MQILQIPPLGPFFFHLVPPLSATLSRPLAIEPPALDLQRGELVVEVGERGVEVRIVRRRTIVDGREVDEVGRGEKRLVNRDLAQENSLLSSIAEPLIFFCAGSNRQTADAYLGAGLGQHFRPPTQAFPQN